MTQNLFYEKWSTHLKNEVVKSFHEASIVKYFPSFSIPAISDFTVQEAYIDGAGFSQYGPVDETHKKDEIIDPAIRSFKVTAVRDRFTMSKFQWDLFTKSGALPAALTQMAERAAYSMSCAISYGRVYDADNSAWLDQPYTQYNFLQDPSTGNGTAVRPLPVFNTSGVAWNSTEDVHDDIATLVASMVSKGLNPADLSVWYPMSRAKDMMKVSNATTDRNAIFYLEQQGINRERIRAIPDIYMWPQGGSAVSGTDWDLWILDESHFPVGYSKAESVEVYPPIGRQETYEVRFECFFCLWPRLYMRTESGTQKYYKRLGILKDIGAD